MLPVFSLIGFGGTSQISGTTRNVRGATQIAIPIITNYRFQSTHPRGVRRAVSAARGYQKGFQSTHPRGVRPSFLFPQKGHVNFNPRTHVGCDRAVPGDRGQHLISIHAPTWGATVLTVIWSFSGDFNPRTHVGCDRVWLRQGRAGDISIHAPTWGATCG